MNGECNAVEDTYLLNMDKNVNEKLFFTRKYFGSLLFNLAAFILPALYSTLSKLWIANIDRSQVATTDVYTYIGVVVNVLNEGLPRTAWLIIGDKSTRSTKSRLSFAYTMIAFQIGFGIILSTIFIVLSPEFASAFVPREARKTSIMYVRISSMSALSSAMEVVVGCCTRAMDKPNVPLLISSVKFVVNIILDMLFISKWHVGIVKPEVTTQALIRMVCDLTSASFGLIYFIYISKKFQSENLTDEKCKPSLNCLKILMRPAIYTFAESVIRNGIYLWLIRNIVSMGSDYSTAFGVFNSIRWGLVMVPVQALEASALTFVGHHWGQWRARVGVEVRRPNATNKDLLDIAKPALISTGIALIIEVLMCIFMTFYGVYHFAFYLSQSEEVAKITQKMWITIDWCYILFAVSCEISTILMATLPRWYLFQALISNLTWMLPWAIIVSQLKITSEEAWRYHSLIFGGALVVNFICSFGICAFWAFMLKIGRISLPAISPKI